MRCSSLHPPGERFLRGEGPRRIRSLGGGGMPLYGDGLAAEWTVHPGLTAIARLRMLCYLRHHGWTRGPALARALGIPETSVHGALHGMKDFRLVENRPAPIKWPRSRSRTGGVYAMEWRATESGLDALCRFGEITASLIPGLVHSDGYGDMEGLEPWEALRLGVDESLLRPVGLAVAFTILWRAPMSDLEMSRAIEIPRGCIDGRIRAWTQRGWLDRRPDPWDPRERFWKAPHYFGARWGFNPAGLRALKRHIQALCWATEPPDRRAAHKRPAWDLSPYAFGRRPPRPRRRVPLSHHLLPSAPRKGRHVALRLPSFPRRGRGWLPKTSRPSRLPCQIPRPHPLKWRAANGANPPVV